VNSLIYAGMGGWMDLKKEINPGDYVMYDDGLVVVDDFGNPLKVVKINFSTFLPSVTYENGEYDWLHTVEKIPELIKELL
jgi:hypothetical protein